MQCTFGEGGSFCTGTRLLHMKVRNLLRFSLYKFDKIPFECDAGYGTFLEFDVKFCVFFSYVYFFPILGCGGHGTKHVSICVPLLHICLNY